MRRQGLCPPGGQSSTYNPATTHHVTYDQTLIYLDFGSYICKMGIASGSENDYDSILSLVLWAGVRWPAVSWTKFKDDSTDLCSLVLASPERHTLAGAETGLQQGQWSKGISHFLFFMSMGVESLSGSGPSVREQSCSRGINILGSATNLPKRRL